MVTRKAPHIVNMLKLKVDGFLQQKTTLDSTSVIQNQEFCYSGNRPYGNLTPDRRVSKIEILSILYVTCYTWWQVPHVYEFIGSSCVYDNLANDNTFGAPLNMQYVTLANIQNRN